MLVKRSWLKKLTIKGKIKATKQWIDDYLDSSVGKLIVAGWHTEPLVELSKHYKAGLINGSVNSFKKREMVKDFEKNDQRILFVQIKAIGTGTDGLQYASSDMLVTELPDKPAELDQLISRLDREGQDKQVNVSFLLGKNSIDELILKMLENKEFLTSLINKGEDVSELTINRLLIHHYLKCL